MRVWTVTLAVLIIINLVGVDHATEIMGLRTGQSDKDPEGHTNSVLSIALILTVRLLAN